jgi:hypothetical protein
MKEVENLLDEIVKDNTRINIGRGRPYVVDYSIVSVKYKQLIIAMIKSVDNCKEFKNIRRGKGWSIKSHVTATEMKRRLKTKLIDIIKRGNNE